MWMLNATVDVVLSGAAALSMHDQPTPTTPICAPLSSRINYSITYDRIDDVDVDDDVDQSVY